MTTEARGGGPQAPEAEAALLGVLLGVPNRTSAVITSGLLPEHFAVPAHRLLFEAIVERFYADEPIDAVLVAEQLGRRLDAAMSVSDHGEAVRRVQQLALTPNGIDPVAHADLVRAHADRRRLLALAGQIQRAAEAGELSPEEVAGFASQEAMRIATAATAAEETEGIADVGRSFIRELRRVKAAREAGIELGAYFGIPAFDETMHGLQPSELMIFAGAPGEGKSLVAWRASINFAEAQARRERRIGTLIMSFEMGRYPSSTRVAQMFSGLQGPRLREGDITEAELRTLVRAWRDRRDLPLFFNFSPALRTSQMRAVIAEGVRRHNIGLVVVDHFRYFDLDRRLPNRNDEDDEKVRFLKTLARSLDVAIICLAHTRKKGTDTRDPRPKLSDLRGSGQISADSDFVCFLHRPYKYATEEERAVQDIARTDAELIWEKNRHGFDGSVKFFVDPEQMKVA